MNLPKQDRNRARTASDIERKYGKKVNETEKEVKSQSKDLASLNVSVKILIKNIETINNQIEEINEKYEDLGVVIDKINIQVEKNTQLSHSHANKEILDSITDQDINNWNDKFDGSYKVLGNNIEVNQTVTGISNYNLVLVRLQNINRYVPLYKYQNAYKGINVEATEEGIIANEIAIETEAEKIVSIISNYQILEIIGVF